LQRNGRRADVRLPADRRLTNDDGDLTQTHRIDELFIAWRILDSPRTTAMLRTIGPASDTRESQRPREAAVALAQAREYCTPRATLTVAKRMPTAV